MTESINMIEQAGRQDAAILESFPVEGMGKRAMGCKMYDKCLYRAAVKNWDSFNCDGCGYEGQGALEFIEPYFIPEFEEPGITPEEDQEMELVDLSVSYSPMSFIKEILEYNEHAA